MTRIYVKGNYLVFQEADKDTRNLTDNIYVEIDVDLFLFYRKTDNKLLYSIRFADILDVDGNAYESQTIFTDYIDSKTGTKGSMDVVVQDSTSPLVILKASKLVLETTLTAAAVRDTRTVTVASVTGVVTGQQLTLYSVINNRVSTSTVLSIATNTITVDSPIDFAYEIGAFAQFGSTNLAVNGSVTPQIFGIRNPTAQDIELSVDFTRMILSMQTTTLGNLNQFGNITALTKGLVCRFKNGEWWNVFNVKTNRGFDNLMYDFKFIASQGGAPDGLSGRFTFSNLGAVIRLRPFEDLQFIVQDNLTGITRFEIILEGAGVVD